MASIIKRKKNYSVVYNYVDENGETKQKWETWHTHKEALKRKAEIENQQHTGTFLPPSNQTITEFLYDFVSLYGEKKWGVSMYDSQTALIANYINPIIGDMEVQAVTPRAVDGYIQTLQKTKSVSTKTRKAVTTYVSDKTIVWGDRIFEKCGIRRDEGGDGGKTLEIRGKRRLSARDGGANYQQS